MTSPKRVLQLLALAAFTLCASAAFADEAVAPKTAAAVASPQAKAEAPSPQEGFNFADLGIPEPTNRSCTASTTCSFVGGTPVMCTGTFTCVQNANWVKCDGAATVYCTCNPANIPNCADPVGFCNCWSASPTNGFLVCKREFC
jgi:hypothetical protein